MSKTDHADGTSTAVHVDHGLDRVEGITTDQRIHRRPARHGGAAKFVLQDRTRDAASLHDAWDVGDYRTIPDGSLYQHARAAWYAHEDDLVEDGDGREYAVLSRSYQHPDEDEPTEYAVTLRSSRWKAGTDSGGQYRPWYKYDLTLQPLNDDGSINWYNTPARALSLKIIPQAAELVYPDGNDLELPHGEGSLVEVQATWVQEPEEFVERAAHLAGSVLDYGLRSTDIVDDSKGFRKAEVHHRIAEEREGDLVHTLRQSGDLLARHEAEVETYGQHDGARWTEAAVRTREWEQLGFGRLDADVLAKLYYPDAPDYVDYPMDQPKFEVALMGKETVLDEDGQTTQQLIPWDRWSDIVAHLEEILLGHLEWADVGPSDLVADDYSDGPNAQRVAFSLPEGRRTWLRNHYESLVPALYREATRARTDLVYDILDVVHKHGPVTYERLVEETGAAYRTVREHVRRLEEDVGGDGPGLLTRIRDAVTFVAFSSRYLEEIGESALDTINPDDTPADREERAEQRREDREQLDQDDDATGASETASDRNDWRYLADLALDGDRLAAALDRGHLDDRHVRVRVDPYSWLHDPGG